MLKQVYVKLKKFYCPSFVFKLVLIYFLLMASVYSLMSLVKHSHFQTFADLGIFNQGIWQYSRFKWPQITFHLHRPFLGDHFHPILILLSPLYWFYSSEEVLLLVQPFIFLSAIIPIFLISFKLIKSLFFSLVVILAFSFYLPTQYTIFYDFHSIIFLPPLFAWAFYFFIHNKTKLMHLFLALLLLVKEEVGFFVAAFGLYLFIFKPGWRKKGLFWFLAGIAYSFLTMYWLIPQLGGSYLYFGYGSSGDTPVGVMGNLIKNPDLIWSSFFDSSLKKETLFWTFWPWGFLPLLHPLSLLLSLEQFASRFLDYRTQVRWQLGYHYSSSMAIIMSLGTILTVAFLLRCLKNKKIKKAMIIFFSLILIFLTRIEQINRSAILLIKRKQFWQRQDWMDWTDQALALVPSSASIASQNNLISHLSTRKNVYSLKDIDKTEYILVNFQPGQSDYNFFGAEKRQYIEEKIKSGIEKGQYKIVFQKGEVYLVKSLVKKQ